MEANISSDQSSIQGLGLFVNSPELTVAMTVTVLVSIYNCIGNILLLVAILKHVSLRTLTNTFIASECVADFLFGTVFLLMLCLKNFLPERREHILFQCLFCAMGSVSFNHLLAIALDRVIKMTKPLLYQNIMTAKLCYCIILLMWIYGFVLFLLLRLVPDFSKERYIDLGFILTKVPMSLSVTLVIHNLLMYVTSSLLYGRILHYGYRRKQIISDISIVNHQMAVEYRQDIQITKMAAMRLFTFSVSCFLPVLVFITKGPDWVATEGWFVIGYLQLLLLSSCGHNIWIYSIGDSRLRRGIAKLFTCNLHCPVMVKNQVASTLSLENKNQY